MKVNSNHSLRHYVGIPQGDLRRGWLQHSMHEEVPGCLQQIYMCHVDVKEEDGLPSHCSN
jgi:hypothetical protein